MRRNYNGKKLTWPTLDLQIKFSLIMACSEVTVFLCQLQQPERLHSFIQTFFISNGCGGFVVSIMHALRVESWIHNELPMPSRRKSASCAEVTYRVFLPYSFLQNHSQRQQEGDKSHIYRKITVHLQCLSYTSIAANCHYKKHSSSLLNSQLITFLLTG